MNPDGKIIPLTEDDQGEGVKDFLDIFDIPIQEQFTDSEYFKKIERYTLRKEVLKNMKK